MKPYLYIKGILEFVVILIFLPIAILIFIIVSILIYLKMGWPVIFTQKRGGLKGKIFNIYKFRTMIEVYDEHGELLGDEYRITRLGKILRASSLDELPSIYNVFKRDMGLIGPRPFMSKYLPLYSKNQMKRHDIRPGVTGWAQVNGRNAIGWNDKIELDLWYVRNVTFWIDLKILFLTVWKVFRKEGIDSTETITMEEFKGE